MPTKPRIRLTYFDARGRAQYLRYYLLSRDVAFEDHRVPLSGTFSEWLAIRPDRSVCGPFHKLPVLRWNEQLVPETSVIQAFLHEQLGDRARLSDEDNLRHGILSSTLSIDVMMPIGMLIWADVAYQGVDVAAMAKRTSERLRAHLVALDRTLDEWGWVASASERPVMLADCFLWEELSVAKQVFGDVLKLEETPTLNHILADSPVRAVADDLLRARACQITGRPAEADMLAKLTSVLAA
jgi:hypothetical protein